MVNKKFKAGLDSLLGESHGATRFHPHSGGFAEVNGNDKQKLIPHY